ncbi:MAG: histidine kinase [Marinoscillum sp.]
MNTKILLLILVISGFLVSWLSSYWIYPIFQPVMIEYVREFLNDTSSQRYYFDLDGDGGDEVVFVTLGNRGVVGLNLISSNKATWQENFDGYLVNDQEIAISNIDGDSLNEVSIVYFRNDSLFMGVIEFSSNELLIHDRFLSTIKYKGRPEEDIHIGISSFDFDKDLKTEVLVNVSSGYGLYPRKLFVYHPLEDSIYQTPDDWEILLGHPRIHDFNGDGVSEIWTSGHSPGNSPDTTIKYHDHKGWGMVFDSYLNQYPGEISRAISSIKLFKSEEQFLVRIQSMDDSGSDWYKMNFDGEVVLYNHIKRFSENLTFMTDSLPALAQSRSKIGLVSKSFRVEKNLKIKPFVTSHGRYQSVRLGFNTKTYLADINKSGITLINEVLEPSFYSWPNDFSGRILVQDLILDKEQLICFQNAKRGVIFRVMETSYRFDRVVALIIVFLSWVLLGYCIYKFYLYQRQSRLARLYKIQMQALRNQINPHFALNLMSSIRLSIMKEDVLRADELLDNFTRILRYGLDNSEEIEVELYKEIEQVKTYLEIERDQCDSLVDFQIDVQDSLRTFHVPKMLIHEHVENAIKHGIRNLQTNDGRITVTAVKKHGKVQITVEDNGNGIKGFQKMAKKGSGLKLTEELIEIFNKLTGRKVSQRIEVLPRGTKVTITA